MRDRTNQPGNLAKLRRRAEEINRQQATQLPENIAALSPEEIQDVFLVTLHWTNVQQDKKAPAARGNFL